MATHGHSSSLCTDADIGTSLSIDQLPFFQTEFFANWTSTMRRDFICQSRKALFADNSRAKFEIIIYSVLFTISMIGNVTAFVNLLRKSNRKKRINRLVIHLSVADLMVTFFTIPFELGWRFTITWKGGVVGCKLLQILRMFGLYLSSMVLIAISIDRYYAIVHPLKTNFVSQRNRRLLVGAWLTSICLSLPQVSQKPPIIMF